MDSTSWRDKLISYIRANALPPDKFSHQARLYYLARILAREFTHDDDLLFAAAWLHDLGVFIGHRPESAEALARWDHVAYSVEKARALLSRFGFPTHKIGAVLECIRGHLPAAHPERIEAVILRDADILEQLGAVGILRTASKVGRDTRFIRFSDALNVLHGNLENLPKALRLETARRLAEARIALLADFLRGADSESSGIDW